MNLRRLFERNPDFVFRKIADETILVPIKQKVGDLGCLYSLNATAARIWELLDGTRDLQSIRDILIEEFEATEEQVTRDLVAFVEKLSSIEAICEIASRGTTDRQEPSPGP
jgi:hypothetical protein